MCENPKDYLARMTSEASNTIVCDTQAQHNGLFYAKGTMCRFENCDKGNVQYP